jgi:hypothetical protein
MPPDIKVIKLKVRRGSDIERKQIKLDQGELGFTTDTQRLFVGNGVDLGGVVVGNKIFTPVNATFNTLSTINAQVGDIVPLSGVSYQLTNTDYTKLSSWTIFSPSLNTTYLKYSDNQTGNLTIVDSSLDASVLNTQSLSSSTINFNSNKLNVNYDTRVFSAISTFSILSGGLSSVHISTETVGRGLSGGNGTPIFVDVDGTTIGYVGGSNKLSLISSPVTALRTENLGAGFNITYSTSGVRVNANIANIDTASFLLCAGNTLALKAPALTATQSFELPAVNVVNGYIAGVTSSIYDILSCNVESSPYNGAPDQVTKDFIPSWGHTVVPVLSNGNISMSLSSAGFIVFRGQETVRNGQRVTDSFAIPVFTLPSNIS